MKCRKLSTFYASCETPEIVIIVYFLSLFSLNDYSENHNNNTVAKRSKILLKHSSHEETSPGRVGFHNIYLLHPVHFYGTNIVTLQSLSYFTTVRKKLIVIIGKLSPKIGVDKLFLGTCQHAVHRETCLCPIPVDSSGDVNQQKLPTLT